jgi:YgiT-type zinc finger domain-containing protein
VICEYCGGKTIKRKVRKVHWLQQQLYIVDDVEAEVCQECGERYYHATTLDAIDRMLATHSHVIKEQLQVQVVAMPT